MVALKLTKIGNALGVVLPNELLRRLQVETGDLLCALETPDGIEIVPYDSGFAAQMRVAERVMEEDRAVLKKLAE